MQGPVIIGRKAKSFLGKWSSWPLLHAASVLVYCGPLFLVQSTARITDSTPFLYIEFIVMAGVWSVSGPVSGLCVYLPLLWRQRMSPRSWRLVRTLLIVLGPTVMAPAYILFVFYPLTRAFGAKPDAQDGIGLFGLCVLQLPVTALVCAIEASLFYKRFPQVGLAETNSPPAS